MQRSDSGTGWTDLVRSVRRESTRYLYRVEVADTKRRATPHTVTASGPRKTQRAKSKKVSRNAPCPYGSGRKAKKCSATADCLGAWRS